MERQRTSISHSPVRCCRCGLKIRSNALCLHIFSASMGLGLPLTAGAAHRPRLQTGLDAVASAHYQAQQYAHHAEVGIAEGGVGKAEIPQHRQQEGDQQAIAGFDDSDVVQACYPALTSVQIPYRKMGDMAAEMILRKLAGEVLQDGTQTI